MMVKIEFETDNAAFEDMGEKEVYRILDSIKSWIGSGASSGYIHDYNGNTVGEWSFHL